jgi:hypothetical protein
MASSNGGGPAFPRPASEYTKSGSCPDGNDPIQEQDGMSLRDYFAAQAMAGLTPAADLTPVAVAELAYAYADAMLVARQQT